jgi:phage-related protein
MSDFAWIPDFVVVTDSEWKTLESEAENGTKQYRSVWPTNKSSFRLTFKNRTVAVAQAVLAFFNLKKGKATSFTWTSPLDSVEYTVRFASDKLSYEYISYGLCDFTIDFEEDTT